MDTLYAVFLFLHIVAAIIAAGSLFVLPALARADAGAALRQYTRLVLPALALGGIAGYGLVGLSDGGWTYVQTWVLVSQVLWVAVLAVGIAVVRPALAAGAGGRSRLSAGIGASHLLLLVIVALMVFKPGA